MGVPDSLIAALEHAGNTVYPVNTIQLFIKTAMPTPSPAAIINMAHGRMGDMVVNYLTANNIPLFSPLNVNRSYDEWMADKMVMNGGFLSQSVVTPEIDGAVRPFSLFAHYEGKDGLPYVAAIPGRLEEFVETVGSYISLQKSDNRDKKIAIFYFKGPGQNALVAEGMEVGPSLFNLLTRLKKEGYRVENLPSTAAELEQRINDYGKVFNQYALGAKDSFVKTHSPEVISKEDYDRWCNDAFSKEMRAEIDAVDGDFPGHGLKPTTVASRSHASNSATWCSFPRQPPDSATMNSRLYTELKSLRPTTMWPLIYGLVTDSMPTRSSTSALTAVSNSLHANKWHSAATTGLTDSLAQCLTSMSTRQAMSARP